MVAVSGFRIAVEEQRSPWEVSQERTELSAEGLKGEDEQLRLHQVHWSARGPVSVARLGSALSSACCLGVDQSSPSPSGPQAPVP